MPKALLLSSSHLIASCCSHSEKQVGVVVVVESEFSDECDDAGDNSICSCFSVTFDDLMATTEHVSKMSFFTFLSFPTIALSFIADLFSKFMSASSFFKQKFQLFIFRGI
jgi:hypothetical protein